MRSQQTLDKVYAESGQPVYAVTVSPTGGYLVLGTGNYSLSTAGLFQAQIEMWSYDSEWQRELVAPLPGANVDWLGWYEDSGTRILMRLWRYRVEKLRMVGTSVSWTAPRFAPGEFAKTTASVRVQAVSFTVESLMIQSRPLHAPYGSAGTWLDGLRATRKP